MMNIEIRFRWSSIKKVIAGIIVSVTLLSGMQLKGISVAAAETDEIETNSDAVPFVTEYNNYYTAVTSDPKKVYFTTSKINLPINREMNIHSVVGADPKIERTIPSMKGAKFHVGNTKIAEIQGSVVIPKKIGRTYLYVETPNKLTAKVLLNVTAEQLNDPYVFMFSEASASVALNQTIDAKDYTTLSVSPGDTYKKATYKTGNSKIATVTKDGKVKGVSKGNTWLYAVSRNGIEARVLLKVVDNVKATSVSLPDSQAMVKGETKKISYEVTPKNAYVGNITWRVGNSKVATVNKSGTVTAVGEGNTMLYAKPSNGEEVKTLIKVIDESKPIKFVFENDTVKIDSKEKYISYSLLNSLGGSASAEGVKISVGNPKVARIVRNYYGRVTLEAMCDSGSTWLNFETKDGLKARILIKVEMSKLKTFAFNSKIVVNKSKTVNVYDYLNTGTEDAYKYSIKFYTSNDKVAKIDNEYTNTLIGEKSGNTWLYAECQGKKIKTLVTVKDGTELQKISFSKPSLTIDVTKDNVENVKVKLYPENTAMKNVSLTTGNEAVAKVDQYGNVKGLKNGSTYLYATGENGVTNRIFVQVKGYSEIKNITAPNVIDINLSGANGVAGYEYDINLGTKYPNNIEDLKIYAGNPNILDVNYYNDYYSDDGSKKHVRLRAKAQGNTYVYYKAPNGKIYKTLVRIKW